MGKVEKKVDVQQTAMQHVLSSLSDKTRIQFTNESITFHDDTCGQRQHKVEQYVAYGYKVKNHLKVTRVLSFTNKVDEGKDGAVLAIINMEKLNVVSVHITKVVFDLLTIYLK